MVRELRRLSSRKTGILGLARLEKWEPAGEPLKSHFSLKARNPSGRDLVTESLSSHGQLRGTVFTSTKQTEAVTTLLGTAAEGCVDGTHKGYGLSV